LTKPFSGHGQHGLRRHGALKFTEKSIKSSIFSVMSVQSVYKKAFNLHLEKAMDTQCKPVVELFQRAYNTNAAQNTARIDDE
jgi:hypothetical protein